MADLYDYALVTVADVKASPSYPGGVDDDQIKRKINQATDIIETFCNLSRNHHFKATTYTNEVYNGSNSNTLSLLMSPVISISSFQRHDSPENGASYSDVESNLYYSDLSSGTLQLLYNSNDDWASYRVTYRAGYETIPYDLQEACISLANYLISNSTAGTNVKRVTEGARSKEYFQQQGSTSLVEDLGLDDILRRYVYYAVGA